MVNKKEMADQPYTTLSNGVQMPLLGLGVYDMYNKEAEEAVESALEIGYRLIDTASLYNNEREVGDAIRKSGLSRNEIFVTTKVGNNDQGFDSTLRAFDDSMKKLNIEYIDLYLVHWPIKEKRKDTWLALEKLYKEKRVGAIGVANYLIPFLHELLGYATLTPMLDQVELSPWLVQKDLMNYCKEKSIQLQSYSPLTRGYKLTDQRLLKLCKKYDKTPAQVVLQWNMEHGISVIPKSANKERLQENFESLNFRLSKEDVIYMDGFHEDFRICDDPLMMY